MSPLWASCTRRFRVP